MKRILGALTQRDARPFTLLAAVILVLAAIDHGSGFFFGAATAFSVMQLFATYGLVSLGVGLSLLVREFDISVVGMVGLAGAIAVLTGAQSPLLGAAAGLAAGLAGGAAQGFIMTRLRLNSVGVTLGGLLSFTGLTYVITDGQSITYPRMDVALALNANLGGLLSVRSVVALAVFGIAAIVMGTTRIGRDLLATGGDRRAAATAGVRTDRILVGVFACSGLLAALTGVLLSYGLGAASPVALSDMLAPAAAAAIMGGVSLVGGRGRPFGIAAGVLILCLLRSGLNAIGVSPYVHDIVTGGILLAIAILDAPDFARRLTETRLHWQEGRNS